MTSSEPLREAVARDLFRADDQMPFPDWMAILNRLAERSGMQVPLEAQTGEECWKLYYSDGYSPAAAWAEECSND